MSHRNAADKCLAKELREARRAVPLTGTQVRRRARIHEATLSLIESGKQAPSVSQLRRLARTYGIEIVVSGARATTRPAAAQPAPASPPCAPVPSVDKTPRRGVAARRVNGRSASPSQP